MAAYEQAMKDPSVQAQAQQMAQVMQSKEMMDKMARLQVRPDETHRKPMLLHPLECWAFMMNAPQ